MDEAYQRGCFHAAETIRRLEETYTGQELQRQLANREEQANRLATNPYVDEALQSAFLACERMYRAALRRLGFQGVYDHAA